VLGDRKRERFRLVGISGTSGGAICALLAWYGLLKGGAPEAAHRLDDFWSANATQRPLEWLHNYWLTSTLDLMRFELQLSPYILPLSAAEYVATRVWPLAAAWWPFYAPMRADYFQLDKLIGERVDFKVIGKLGVFWSIARLLERWEITALRPQGSPDLVNWENQPSLEQEILARLGARRALREAAQSSPHGLLARAFSADAADDESWNPAAEALVREMEAAAEGDGRFTTAQVSALKQKIERAMHHIPLLLLGAVDIATGEFTAFSSECAPHEGGITEDAAAASACLPGIFPATELKRQVEPAEAGRNKNPHKYWDGLFSQNPPIKDFVSGRDSKRKPDEIWAIQINPQRTEKKFEVAPHIWNRRNELAGNLSLNQEIAFIDAINQRIDLAKHEAEDTDEASEEPRANGIRREDDQLISVLRLPLEVERIEEESGLRLGPASKFNRDARLKDLLMACGRSEAGVFRPVRDFIQDYWNADRRSGAHGEEGWETRERALPPALVAAVGSLSDAPLKVRHCLVDDVGIHHRGAVGTDDAYDVAVRWHAWSMEDATRQLLCGSAVFRVEDGRFAGGVMKDVWVIDRRPARSNGGAPTPSDPAPRARAEHRSMRVPAPYEHAGARPKRRRAARGTTDRRG
jgi:predicted acylesterase/phospholipase RssA